MTDARMPPATTTHRRLPGQGTTNEQYFAGKAFDTWARREGLTDEEALLVERCLDGRRSTLEAGTGGGRILLELHERGFADLHGFDYVPEFIGVAKQRDASRSLQLSVQSAVALNYPDIYFEQAIYLQQVLCFIEPRRDRFAAMREARRVLKPGGTALFSFLCYEARMKTPLYAAFATYLQVTRAVRGRARSLHYQPWLKNGTKPNFSALLDRPPYVYWYTISEAVESLENAGFSVNAAGSHAQLRRHELFDDPARLDGSNAEGMLYLVCTRQ